MRIGICGGPYGNPHALRAFTADARARGCQALYCLGDLGGFGPSVNELWPILTSSRIECIAGNYDIALARGDPDCGCGYRDPRDNDYAQLIYAYTRAHTSREFAAWMGRLPAQRRLGIAGCDVHLVHGSPLAVNDFWWQSLPEQEHRARVSASGAGVICCTHSGLPWQRRVGGTLVVNVGVLGKPANDGRREVWYAVLDLSAGRARAELVPLAYDWQAQSAAMRRAGLPEAFAETIETGWWTTCVEILPPRERAAGRYQLYRSALPAAFRPADSGWGAASAVTSDGHGVRSAGHGQGRPERTGEQSGCDGPLTAGKDRPVVPLFGSPYFPARLWVYTNFHCNLACDYCAAGSFPRAPARALTADRFCRLIDEALAEEFTELYVTGGEPFLHPDISTMLGYASQRLPVVVLTNAMLWRGRRLAELAGLARRTPRGRLVIQTSLDGARPASHDTHRGAGSWARTLDGIRHAVDLGLPIRVGMTETPDNAGEAPQVARLLASLGIGPGQFAVRPLLRRGLSDAGLDISQETTIPELTVTASGLHWHPAGADAATSPDMLLAGPGASLAEGKRLVAERFFAARQADGSLPRLYRCAV